MRFLENEGDNIEVFESILNELANKGTNDIIPDLCIIFEDHIAEPSAGDYLVETIFYIAKHSGVEEGLLLFLKCYLMQNSRWKEFIGHFYIQKI